MTDTELNAIKIVAKYVIPDVIDLCRDGDFVTRPCAWTTGMLGKEGEILDDDAVFDIWTRKFNTGLKKGAFVPIPIEHPVYEEILGNAAAELVIVSNGDEVFGIDRHRGMVVMRTRAFVIRVFWMHGVPRDV